MGRRKDTWVYTLTVEGRLVGTARAAEGMDIEIDELKVRPGGGAKEVALGGVKTRNNATMRFWNTESVDDITPYLERVAGYGTCTVQRTPIDGEQRPNGRTRTFTGVLGAVKPPEYDADSNDAAELEVEVSLNEEAT